MKLNDVERAIIAGIAADASRIAALPWQGAAWGKPLARHHAAILDAKEGIVALEPTAWLGRALSPSELRAFYRTCQAMQGKGLIVRYGERRCTQLGLTPLGQKYARLIELKGRAANA
jgi:hypothetical protein